MKSIYLARGKRFRNAASQTRIASRLSLNFKSNFKGKTFFARKTLPQHSISDANCVQAQPGDSIKKEGSKNGTFFFGGEGGTHSVTPRLKTVHRTVFPEKAPAFSVGSFESPLLQFDKKRRSHKWDLLFLAEKGGLEPPRQFLDRPTPLAGAPRHQLEYFSRLVSGLRLYSLLETAVLNSFLFLCR